MNIWSKKQSEFINAPFNRWSIKCGATRSGKTYLDYFIIPQRLREVRGKEGLVVILGNTRSSIERNIIRPMQQIWGLKRVGDIRSNNICTMFGEDVYCLGADKISQVDSIRGSSIKYCYGDEVVTWHPEVFEMLKTRLDKSYSRFDGTCNPESPEHWLKKFIDENPDVFYQQYSLFDNPYLPPSVLNDMCSKMKGVFYQRYVLGEWCLGSGLIYKQFAENEEEYMINAEEVPRNEIGYICVGQDFGGNKSKHTYCATGITKDYSRLYVLKSREFEGTGKTVDFVVNQLDLFCKEVKDQWGYVDYVFADSAEQTIINTERQRLQWMVRNSIKNPIIDRIRAEDLLLSSHRVKFVRGENSSVCNALRSAIWDKDAKVDTRLDIPGTTNICPLDSFEYSWEFILRNIIGGI